MNQNAIRSLSLFKQASPSHRTQTNSAMLLSSRFGFLALTRRCIFATGVFTLFVALSTALPVQAERLPVVDDAIQAGLFEAMDAKQIDVKYIPLDATKANVIIKNLTDKPVDLRLPAAFAGVPVLAQFGGGMGGGGMGGGGMGGGGMGGGGGGQAGGGGMGGGGMGGGGMGGGGMGGMMRVSPKRTHKMSVATVCLEHGKPDPNPKMPYKIVPLSEFTKDENVRVVCEALGNGLVTQNSAQAAAWHLMDKMPWNELAAKNRSESRYTGTVRWFSPIELRTAMALVVEADRITRQRDEYVSEYDEYDKKDSDS